MKLSAGKRFCRQTLRLAVSASVLQEYSFNCPSSYELACELEGKPERELRESQQPVAGIFPIAQGSKVASGYRGIMTTHRTSGPQAHGTKSALTQHPEATLSLYQEILRGLPVGIVVLQLENPRDVKSFRITDVNRAAALFSAGATLEDLRGRTLAEFPKLLKTRLPRRCLDVFQSREPTNLGEISYGDEWIREGIYSVQVFPLIENFVGVAFENVTERKQADQALRQSEERFRLLVQGVQEYAIFNLDPLGNIVSWNNGAERLKGYRAEEIIGKHFSAFYPPEDVADGKPQKILEEAAQRGQSEDEGWRVRKDGSRFWANGGTLKEVCRGSPRSRGT